MKTFPVLMSFAFKLNLKALTKGDSSVLHVRWGKGHQVDEGGHSGRLVLTNRTIQLGQTYGQGVKFVFIFGDVNLPCLCPLSPPPLAFLWFLRLFSHSVGGSFCVLEPSQTPAKGKEPWTKTGPRPGVDGAW